MKIILSIVIALIIGGGAGYVFGKSGDTSMADAKKLQDSVSMMKEQSAAIKKMGEMMKSSGGMLQTVGMKYNDEEVVASGKDMEAVGTKYLGENAKAEGSGSMKQTMGN